MVIYSSDGKAEFVENNFFIKHYFVQDSLMNSKFKEN